MDNEELYFTKRLNGSIADEDVEKAKEELNKYIYEDTPFMSKKIESDFDKFCYNHCKYIETIINELKYKEVKIKELEKYEKYYQTEKVVWSRNDYISKDKIIKLLNKYDKESFLAKIDLQELLEEGDK